MIISVWFGRISWHEDEVVIWVIHLKHVDKRHTERDTFVSRCDPFTAVKGYRLHPASRNFTNLLLLLHHLWKQGILIAPLGWRDPCCWRTLASPSQLARVPGDSQRPFRVRRSRLLKDRMGSDDEGQEDGHCTVFGLLVASYRNKEKLHIFDSIHTKILWHLDRTPVSLCLKYRPRIGYSLTIFPPRLVTARGIRGIKWDGEARGSLGFSLTIPPCHRVLWS